MTGDFSPVPPHVDAADAASSPDSWRSDDQPSPPQAPDDAYWRSVRSQFDLKPGWAFLNHGTLGPTPRGVSEISHRIIDELARDPASNLRDGITAVRARLAAFINAGSDEVALTRSTTEGMNIFAHGLDWQPGDEVVLGTHEHFGGVQPYQTLQERVGIRIVEVALPPPPVTAERILAAYEAALTPRTRVIVVSHVSYVTGLVVPIRELAALAHARGVLISVDGAQSFGVLPLDLRGSDVDHYAGSGQKWFLAGTGTGFSYIKRELHESVWPLAGYHNPAADQHGPYAGLRYERVGQKNVPSLFAIGAALDLHAAIGPQIIARRVGDLASRLRGGLQEIPGVRLWTGDNPALTAGLTTFGIDNLAPATIVSTLRDEFRIVIRPINHAEVNGVRASTHFFNEPEEVDQLVAAVRVLTERSTVT